MPARPPRLVTALVAVVIVAACDAGQPEPSDGTEPTSPVTTGAPSDVEVMTYGFEAGDTFRYAVEIEQHIGLDADGGTQVRWARRVGVARAYN